jgi:sugar phosphate isomerase/epimerase
MAVRHTLKTIEFAQRLNAPAVVMHLGSIEMKDYTTKLLEMLARGEKESPKFEKLCFELAEKREAKKEPFVERTTEGLRKLLPDAEARNIKLGAESRQGLEELPLESDFQFLFRDLPSPNLGYWHDTGHAQIKENLGFIHHAMHLESLCDRLIGFHIHDVQFPGRDHCPPGTGTIDFAALKPFVKPHHIKVFEFGPSMSAEEAKSGIEFVKRVWGDE